MSKLAVNAIMVGKAAEAEKKGAEQDAAEVRNAAAKVKGVSAKPLQPQTKKRAPAVDNRYCAGWKIWARLSWKLGCGQNLGHVRIIS